LKAITAYILLFSLVIIYNQDIEDICTSKPISNRINNNNNFSQDIALANDNIAGYESLNSSFLISSPLLFSNLFIVLFSNSLLCRGSLRIE
jgi:hypothetical protein